MVCSRQAVVIGWLVCIAAFTGETAGAADGPDVRSIALNNVVKIVARDREGTPRPGAGFIVGRDLDDLWIATAKHVILWPVTHDDDARGYDREASVSFLFAPGIAGRPAGAPIAVPGDADIAFFRVRLPTAVVGVDSWRTPIMRSNPRVGEEVNLTIEGNAIKLTHDNGIVGKRAVGSPLIRVTGLRGMRGQSGAPAMTRYGIIGMHVATGFAGPTDVNIIAIDQIEAAAKNLRVRWELVPNDMAPPERAIPVCFGHNGSERPALLVTSAAFPAGPENKWCTEVSVTEVTITPMDPIVRCRPLQVVVQSKNPSPISVTCNPQVAGVWTDLTSGGAQIREIDASDNDYAFKGIPFSNFGSVTGRLSGPPSSLIFNGENGGGMKVMGSGSVSRTELRLQLTGADGNRLSLVLKR